MRPFLEFAWMKTSIRSAVARASRLIGYAHPFDAAATWDDGSLSSTRANRHASPHDCTTGGLNGKLNRVRQS